MQGLPIIQTEREGFACLRAGELRSATRFESSRSTQKTKTASQKGHRLCLAEREGFALEFCEAVCANRSCMPRKILRSPLQTVPRTVCLTLSRIPPESLNEAKKASQMGCHFYLAEREGFEPSVGY